MGIGMSDLELRNELLEREVEALRSVLSEYADKYETDHCEFTQWHKAEAIRALFNHLTWKSK